MDGAPLVVTLTVSNTGQSDAAEVVQLYVRNVHSTVHRPDRELRAFAKVAIPAGGAQQVTLRLRRRAFAVYDTTRSGWCVEAGEFEILLGASCEDIRLRATVTVTSTDAPPPAGSPKGYTILDDQVA